MRYVIRLAGVACCAVGLWAAASTVQAGPHEDCSQPKDRDLQIRACSGIIRRDRKAEWAYYNRGIAYWAKGDYDRAIADYSESIRLIPGDARAYVSRGIAYRAKGDFDRAIADCNEAIRLNPSHANAYISRGTAYWYKEDYDRALADYTEAIRLNPNDAVAYNDRGDTYYSKLDYDRALADYSEAIRLDPTFILAHSNRGETYEAKGDRNKAIEDYSRALTLPATTEHQRTRQAFAETRLAALRGAPPATTPALVAPPPVAATRPAAAPKAATTPSGRRVALVIGNSAYAAIERLANPANDARAVAATLRRLGFAEVIERHDLSLAAMVEAFKAFGDKTANADWAIVYYAGHGIEMAGTTYLIPTDARLMRDAHVPDEALPLDRVLAKVETARRLRLVILDACRNNPFLVRMARAAGPGRSVGRGLARIEPDGGVIVAYAAKHGTIAQDGPAARSPFTEALLAHLEEPGLEINFLFRKVRDRVLDRTARSQEPFVYGSLGSEPLYFKIAGAQ